jgi:hypothetical protein
MTMTWDGRPVASSKRRKPKLIRPGVALFGVVVVAVICMAVIPIPEGALDFARLAWPRWAGTAAGDAASFRVTGWWELLPPGWDPSVQARDIRQEVRGLPDSDPRVQTAAVRLREIYDSAPTNPALEGAAVRVPGYIVPLEGTERGLREFLLVPYFGACIHSPAPPSNQIIHVTLREPSRALRSMDAVWVSGHLSAARSTSARGTSGWALQAVSVEPYVPAERK